MFDYNEFLIVETNQYDGSSHKILVLIAYEQKPPLNVHSDVSSVARDLQ